MDTTINVLITLLLGASFGGITAFSSMFAPLVFTKLPADVAGKFIRAVFPWYYLYILITSAIGALLLLVAGHVFLGLVTLGVAMLAVYSRWVLMPLINELRDAELAGDMEAADQFKVQHRLSVIVNAIQWVVTALVLISWGSPEAMPTVPMS